MRSFARLAALIGSTIMSLAAMALPALADYPPKPPAETELLRGPEAVSTDLAFTGSDVTPLVIAVAVLLVAGISALLIARRRAAAAS